MLHAAVDSALADEIASRLEREGFACWRTDWGSAEVEPRAERGGEAGDPAALAPSVTVVLWSEESVADRPLLIAARARAGERLVPILVKGAGFDHLPIGFGGRSTLLYEDWETSHGDLLRSLAPPTERSGAMSGTGAQPPLLQTLVSHRGLVGDFAYLPDGRTAVSAAGTIKHWDLQSGRLLRTLRRPPSPADASTDPWDAIPFWSVAVMAQGRILATGDGDPRDEGVATAIGIWDLAAGKRLRLLAGHTHGVSDLAGSPDGRTIASLGLDATARSWSVEGGETGRVTVPAGSAAVGFSAAGEGLTAFAEDSSIRVSGLAGPVSTRTSSRAGRSVLSLRFTPGGSALAVLDEDQRLELWTLEREEAPASVAAPPGSSRILALSAGGRLVVSADGDGSARLWATADPRRLWPLGGDEEQIARARFSPDGRTLLTTGHDGTVKLLDVAAV